jgi:hypothetical protein
MILPIALPRLPAYSLGIAIALTITTRASSAQVDPTRGAPPPVQAIRGGDLPSDVPGTAGEFRDLVAKSSLRPRHRRHRLGEGCPKSKGCVIWVEIRGVGKQIVHDSRDRSPGRAVARIRNLSAFVEHVYGLLPYKQAEYYVWVDPAPGTMTPRWTLLKVPRVRGDSVKNVYQKPLQACPPHREEHSSSNDADFKDCSGRTAKEVASTNSVGESRFAFATRGTQLQPVTAEYLLSLPFWLRCVMSGCCY